MIKHIVSSAVVALLACGAALARETITTQEVENYFYADGTMKRSKGQFETTYFVEGDIVTRTRVYDLHKKELIPDDTVYRIQRHLFSDPAKGLPVSGKPLIRAIGQPGLDAVEILMIDDSFVQSVKSTSDYFVISRQKRVK